jgi:hypothetical protein
MLKSSIDHYYWRRFGSDLEETQIPVPEAALERAQGSAVYVATNLGEKASGMVEVIKIRFIETGTEDAFPVRPRSWELQVSTVVCWHPRSKEKVERSETIYCALPQQIEQRVLSTIISLVRDGLDLLLQNAMDKQKNIQNALVDIPGPLPPKLQSAKICGND